MRYRRLPYELREQVHEYYFHKYNGQFFNEQNILSELSHSLKEVRRISLVVLNNPFLENSES